jgi:serine acetyltransferase
MSGVRKMDLLTCFLFVLSEKASDLKEYWRIEVIRKDKFSWRRLLARKSDRNRKFLFWWRLANEMYLQGSRHQRKVATKIQDKLKNAYAADIELGLTVGSGLTIHHHTGIVIYHKAIIGKNFTIRQNTTIGGVQGMDENERMVIGDNVDIGANSCLVGRFHIGDNVTVGAMSFVNKDIPANSTYICRKNPTIKQK